MQTPYRSQRDAVCSVGIGASVTSSRHGEMCVVADSISITTRCSMQRRDCRFCDVIESWRDAPCCRLHIDHNEMQYAARGLALLWQNLTFDELLYAECDTSGLREKTDFRRSGLNACALANIGSALQIQQVRYRAKHRLCEASHTHVYEDITT